MSLTKKLSKKGRFAKVSTKEGEMLLESDEGQGAEYSDEVLLAKKIAFLWEASIL